ncbi:MAG: carboxypeptidase regulatory-like domain-containing protein [Candidatus Acidiferrales bacterium]
MRKLWAVMCVATLCGLLATPAAAQTQITTGVIRGTVVDASGSVVPGANIEARNLDTNAIRSLTSDGDGRFSFLLMPSGRYTLTATKDGFAKLVHENVVLTVGQAITLDLNMAVAGAATQVVTVTGTPTVDVVKTEVSNTLNQTTVSTTPVLGRKFEDLLTLTPGVSVVQGPDGDEITFNGQRGIYNNISLDGGDYNNGFFGEQPGGQRAAIDITLEAVKEFQVIPAGANAEFGRTAGGVINVITKSGTNDVHGSIFHFQRLEALTAENSDGTPQTDFHREQFGATIGGPVVADKTFYFAAIERITGNLERANLSLPIGTPCPQSSFTAGNLADEALIAGSADCQRLALVEFMGNTVGTQEDLPVRRPLFNTAFLGKLDHNFTQNQHLAFSYNFNWSKKINETFDVPTYGNSANGIEGPGKINIFNVNLFSTVSPTKLNELHFTYARENRPRAAVEAGLDADTGVGFAPSFRFGNPFFLGPTIDELIWRTQLKDNFSIVTGRHTIKFGGEWMHTLNDQVFRGFFQGRFIFDSVVGFMRYVSPAAMGAGFGPTTAGCSDGSWVDVTAGCPVGTTATGGPLLLYLQGAGPSGLATDAAGFSSVSNEEFAFFIQDKWQVAPNFTINYGLRWEAQMMPGTVDPTSTAYGIFLSDPNFPSNGTLPDQTDMWQPRFGFAWDIGGGGTSVVRGNAGIYNARLNMLSQVGSVTTNGLQQQTIFRDTPLIGTLLGFGVPFNEAVPTWPNLVVPTASSCMDALGTNPFPCFSGVRVFDRDYHNPRIYTWNVAYEQELAPDWSAYFDFTWSKGVYLTRFINFNRPDGGLGLGPYLGEAMVTNSFGQSLYRGATFGVRKRFSDRFQMEANYVLSGDYDDDSNERDPFTDRALDPFRTLPNSEGLRSDYGFSDRDIRHKFNFFTYGELPWAIEANARVQARSAQPISPAVRTVGNRNTLRKDNEFFSFDWRIQRPFRFGERYELIPIIEMFNTFNNENLVNPLTTPALFNFDGFLRLGVGEPRQLQLAVRFTF